MKSLKEYPPRMASFDPNIDKAMESLMQGSGK